MNSFPKPLFFLRVAIGWLFFYSGITKVLDPDWTSAGFLTSAKTFSGLYAWFASPANIWWVDFLNGWGLTLIGAALILGAFARFASFWGIVLMLLYYFPTFRFPYAGQHSLIVDEHIIYILTLFLLAGSGAGRFWGLDSWLSKQSFIKFSPLRHF